jgi:hypothetical protein
MVAIGGKGSDAPGCTLARVFEPLPPAFAATRDALHAVAEHVLAAARYRAEGRIGLRPTDGGFGTPEFGDHEVVRVEHVDIVHERGGREAREALTTLGAAAAFVGVPLGLPEGIYTPTTAADPDAPLDIDAAAAAALAAWYARSYMWLAEVCGLHPDAEPTTRTLWPEHFDLATELGDGAAGTRGTYGASPGDEYLAEPYLYVSPWEPARRTGPFAEYPFGAARSYTALRSSADVDRAAVDFFASCADLLLRGPG